MSEPAHTLPADRPEQRQQQQWQWQLQSPPLSQSQLRVRSASIRTLTPNSRHSGDDRRRSIISANAVPEAAGASLAVAATAATAASTLDSKLAELERQNISLSALLG